MGMMGVVLNGGRDDDALVQLMHSYMGRKYSNVKSIIIQTSGVESECMEIRWLEDTQEICVIMHGMGLPEGGECVYSCLCEREDGEPYESQSNLRKTNLP